MNIDLFDDPQRYIDFLRTHKTTYSEIDIDGIRYGYSTYISKPMTSRQSTALFKDMVLAWLKIGILADDIMTETFMFQATYSSPCRGYRRVEQADIDYTRFTKTNMAIDEGYSKEQIEHILLMIALGSKVE